MGMRKDAVFINAVCKAEEKNLLSYEALVRLSAAEFDEAIKMLHDYGYNEGVIDVQSFDIDELISKQVNSLINFIGEYSPNEYVENFLLATYLYNDIKAEYKRKLGAQCSKLYMAEKVKEITKGEYTHIDNETAKTLCELDLCDPSPAEIDIAITKAMYAYKLKMAKRSGSSLLIKYSKAEIDIVNLITMNRANRLHMTQNESDALFIYGGNFNLGEEIPKEYTEFDFKDPIKLETEADNYLLALASSQSCDMDSIGPLLSYILRKSSELKTVKMILVCIKSNARNEIPCRLRGIL